MTTRSDIKKGDKLLVTEQFDDLDKGDERTVKSDEFGLYIDTRDGMRRLEVEAGKHFYGLELKGKRK